MNFRWRFEALKLRCILLERESLLEEHKIPFESVKNVESLVQQKFNDGSNETPNIYGTKDCQLVSITNQLPSSTSQIIHEFENDKNLEKSMQTTDDEEKSESPIISLTETLNPSNNLNETGFEETIDLTEESVLNPQLITDMPNEIEFSKCNIKNECKSPLNASIMNKENVASNLESQSVSLVQLPLDQQVTSTAQLKFRDIQITPARRNILKEFSASIVTQTPVPNRRHLVFPIESETKYSTRSEIKTESKSMNNRSLADFKTPKSLTYSNSLAKSECKPEKSKFVVKQISLKSKTPSTFQSQHITPNINRK